jgi:hypothetical protein
MDVEYYRELTRYQFEGRKVILSGAPLAGFTSFVKTALELGATDLFLFASGVGTGELPAADSADWLVLDTRAASMIESFRIMERLLRDPTQEMVERLNRWDPERRAVMLAGPFFYQDSMAGRLVYGWRRPEWLALEDKIIVDEIWDSAGVARAPSVVTPVERRAIERALPGLDRGAGIVLTGDARDGFNGGAEYVRWVADPGDLQEPLEFFGRHCDRVRIMPFLEGIPCSIHGFVFPETLVTLRPCELITLRRPGHRLKYCGAASYWDPTESDRDVMRSVAGRVGEHLRQRVNYRGAFTVDGVMTEVGFLPTELNTRAGAAVGTLLAGLPGLGIGSINRALIEGEQLRYLADGFERLIVETADRQRGGGGWTVVEDEVESTNTVLLARSEAGNLTVSSDNDDPVASLSLGPGEQGGFVRFTPNAGATPVGASVAPLVVEGFRVADEQWNVGLGELAPAPAVR